MSSLPGGHNAIVIANFRADDIKATTGTSLIGIPQPTAFVSFQRNLEIQTGIQFHGVGLLVHEFFLQEGSPKFPADKKGVGATLLEEPRARMRASLVLATSNSFDAFSDEYIVELQNKIASFRLCGSPIWFDEAKNTGSLKKNRRIHLCQEKEDLESILSFLPKGFFLKDRTDLFVDREYEDPLEVFLDAISVIKGEEDKRYHHREEYKGIVPIRRGYRAISEIAERANMRKAENSAGHVFAEEVLGLGQFVSKRTAIKENFSGVLWNFDIQDTRKGIYIVTANQER